MKRLAGAAFAVAVATGLLVAPTAAHAASNPTQILSIADGPGKQQAMQNALSYWTADNLGKINEAVVYDHTSTDPNSVVPDADMTDPNADWDDLSRPWPEAQGLASRTVGKLFVRMQGDGVDYVTTCSANVVTSANKSVVMTAGHCLRVNVPLLSNVTATNVAFVPGFDGDVLRRSSTTRSVADIAPYGIWVATRAYITWGWNFSPNWVLGHDVGTLVVQRPGDSQRIEDVTGAQQITFTRPQNAYVHALGYPANNERSWYSPTQNKVAPALQRLYDGRRMFFAKGQSTTGSLYVDNMLPSALSPGTSGGPFFYNFNEATGTGVQMGVASRFDDPNNATPAGWLLGPNIVGNHLGDEERLAYEAAGNVTITQ
ncbi:hypothetical protein ABGB12_28980 [Actinocorallia sp. B10E7]|uniref:trypsin-like serine peptidase n=1 Tax=Actinocorallia sp. B10E7 TaxID=3153558 RepID=UPI00325F191D